MKRIYLLSLILLSSDLIADDMSFTVRYPQDKNGIFLGIMPKVMPDDKGYRYTETSISPVFSGGRFIIKNYIFTVIFPFVINPDNTRDDIMLNTILLDGGYVINIDNTKLLIGAQMTPKLNWGSNSQNSLNNNASVYTYVYNELIGNLWMGLNLQYYHSFSDKVKYNGLYITRANSGFSIELKVEYYFSNEKLSVLVDTLLFRDISNGVSNLYLNPGVRFLFDELNTVYFTLGVPLYDEKFVERYGSGINLYYDKKF
ncbi:MAG: hypothetical protein N2746_06225 [Deltaproteobacteria bacterium]|nr:hypothetical protein [Deltaproteobacteria bacterium]